MDLTKIESVQDLINQNQKPDLKSILEGVFDLDNIQSFKLMSSLVKLHLDFHHQMIDDLNEKGENIQLWEHDATLLEVALNCINQVSL